MSLEFTTLAKKSIIAIAAAASVLATATSAESIRLVQPSQADALYDDNFGMTVYYLGHANLLEVVATFGERESNKPPSQLRMSLADGDDIEFAVPGLTDMSFHFVRSGTTIEVISDLGDANMVATN